MEPNLTNLKSFLRIDFNDDDAYITSLIDISKDYIKEQTGVKYTYKDSVYNQAVFLMVQHFYDNKTIMTEKAVNEIPYTLTSMIHHIGMRGKLKGGCDDE